MLWLNLHTNHALGCLGTMPWCCFTIMVNKHIKNLRQFLAISLTTACTHTHGVHYYSTCQQHPVTCQISYHIFNNTTIFHKITLLVYLTQDFKHIHYTGWGNDTDIKKHEMCCFQIAKFKFFGVKFFLQLLKNMKRSKYVESKIPLIHTIVAVTL